MANKKVLHKRSSELNKLPSGNTLEVGEIAINFNSENPFLSFKDNANNYVQISGDKVFNDAISALTKTVTDNESDIEKKVSDMDAAYKAADKTLNNAITALTKTVTDNETDIEKKVSDMDTAYKAADKTLENSITALTKTVTDNETDIEKKVSDMDAAYKAADKTLQNSITAITSDYLKASDKTALNNAITALTKTVTDNETDIEKKVSDMDTAYKAADKTLNNAITALTQTVTNNGTANQNALTAHTTDTTVHITANERTDWNKAKSDIDAFLLNADTTTDAVDTLKEIQEFLTGDEGGVKELLNSVAANANAITALTQTVNTNEQDIENKISAVTTNYKAADELLQNQITAITSDYLKTADKTALNNSITALTKTVTDNETDIEQKVSDMDAAYKAADKALNDAITAITGDYLKVADKTALENSITALTKTVTDNETDIEQKVSTVTSNYKAADELLQNQITAITADYLKTADKTALNNAITALTQTVNTNEQDIEQKVSNMDAAYKAADKTLNNSITAITADYLKAADKTALNNSITALTKTVTDNEADIEAKVSAITADYLKTADKTALNNAITALTKTVTDNETDIEAKVSAITADHLTSSDKTALENSITALTKTVTDNETDIEKKVSAITADYLKTADKTALQNQITAITADYLKASDKTALQNSITALTKTVTDNETDIEKKVSDMDAAYKAADKTLQNSITAITSDYLKTADKTALNNAITALTKTVTDNETDIEQKVSTVTSNYKAADKTLNDAITAHTTNTTVHITANERTVWNDTTTKLNAFLLNADTTENAVDTLVEIQEFLMGDEGGVKELLDSVAANTNAITALTKTVTDNETDIEKKVSNMDAAYKAADKTLNNSITAITADYLKAADKTALNNAITALTQTVNTNEQDIEKKVSDMDAAYKAADKTLQNSITALTKTVTDNETDIEKKVSAITADYLTSSDKTALENQITAITIDFPKTSAVTSLNNAITALTQTVNTNEQDIEQKVSNMDAAYKAADKTLQNQITAITADYLKTADKTALQNSITALTKTVTDNETDIEKKVSNMDAAYKAADKTLNNSITAITADYLKTADKTALNNAITALTQTVNTNEQDIEAKVSAITADYLKSSDKTAIENELKSYITTTLDNELPSKVSAEIASEVQLREAADKALNDSLIALVEIVEENEVVSAFAFNELNLRYLDTSDRLDILESLQVNAVNAVNMANVDDGYSTWADGMNTVTSLSNIPISKHFCKCSVSSSGTLTLSSGLGAGREIQILIHNTGSSNITVTMPTSGYFNFGQASIEVAPNSYAEVDIFSDGSLYFIKK